eukprot:3095356-Pleurochrysis_carterae.AAC.1
MGRWFVLYPSHLHLCSRCRARALLFRNFARVRCSRLEKLLEMFSTVVQLSYLSSRPIDGMGPLLGSFEAELRLWRAKPYDLLDTSSSAFDREYLEFNAA